MSALSIGALAPDFTLPAEPGDPVTLSSLKGQAVVLYFYPKDSTPGCTTESCDFRDREAELRALEAGEQELRAARHHHPLRRAEQRAGRRHLRGNAPRHAALRHRRELGRGLDRTELVAHRSPSGST